jgi:hypothetical protein
LVWGQSYQLLNHLKELFDVSGKTSFKNKDKPNYQTIRILDTFLSDSFILDMIKEIIADSNIHKYQVRILLLDPFSTFAESRANALSSNAIKEINNTLFKIREAISDIREKQSLSEEAKDEFKSRKMDPQFLFEQLSGIREFKGTNLDIKFYELLTDTPIYLISQFAMKGFILYNRSSIKNPWMIFVDDPNQEDDLFDHFSRNFNNIWLKAKEIPKSKELPGVKKKNSKSYGQEDIFISHGRNELVKLKITEYVEKELNFNPVLFERHAEYGKGIFESMERLVEKCSSAIIILTREDEQKSGDITARQNVIHELGYCQAKYGSENVVVLVERGTKIPSNISGSRHIEFDIEKLESCFVELARNTKQFNKGHQ